MLQPFIHLAHVLQASDSMCSGGLFQWKMDTGDDRAYSLKPEDYPRLPLFCRTGPAGSVALLNTVFWLVFDELSTWRSMSRLYCNVSDMQHLASSVYPASPAAFGGVCPALKAVPKISRNLVAYLAGLIVVTPYIGRTLGGPPISAQIALVRRTPTSFSRP